VRRGVLVGCATFVVLIAAGVVFDWLHPAGAGGDVSLAPLAGFVAALAWVAGALVVQAGERRVVGLVVLVPTLILAGAMWTEDATPALSASGATRALEQRFHVSHYRCDRAYHDGTVELATLEFQCDPTRSPAYCAHHVCGPRYWFALDGRGRIDQWMLGAP
jgi:hypothetical protein